MSATPPPLPPPLPQSPAKADKPAAAEPPKPVQAANEPEAASRRVARRRPAGPVRNRIAANDDAPSIGGLIYALEQKPSNKPFTIAWVASGVWAAIGGGFSWVMLSTELGQGATLAEILTRPAAFMIAAAVILPIAVLWLLATLAWRAEELRLRSSTMTEVAIRLAEPDRMAEQSVASLGQAVRRQVSFMNDAVSRALGRAGELEALVHSEVAALERSYEENERRIRELIQELSGERHALLNTSDKVSDTLRAMGSEVPALIEKLSQQQVKLATIIQGAGDNLTSLESAITQTSLQLEGTVVRTSEHFEGSIARGAQLLENSLGRTVDRLDGSLEHGIGRLESSLGDGVGRLEGTSATVPAAWRACSTATPPASATRWAAAPRRCRTSWKAIRAPSAMRWATGRSRSRACSKASATTWRQRCRLAPITCRRCSRSIRGRWIRRCQTGHKSSTTSLSSGPRRSIRRSVSACGCSTNSIMRSTLAIDAAVGERQRSLGAALEAHAKNFRDTVAQQTVNLDELLMHGINAVRRSRENITRQSLKAIEGLANQSDLLKNVSENLLGQIGSVTSRFENQGQQIMRAAELWRRSTRRSIRRCSIAIPT